MKKKINFISICTVLLIMTFVLVLTSCTKPKEDDGKEEAKPTTYYIAADGKKENDGLSIGSPKHISLLNSNDLKAGDLIYIIPGTYKWDLDWKTHFRTGDGLVISASGKVENNIRIINAAYDENSGYQGSETKAVLDFSQMAFNGNNRGVQIDGSFIYWYGIDICGAGDNGMYIGGSYNTIEYCDFYNNRDSGLQLGRSAGGMNDIKYWPSYNLIKNCTSHNNYDDETYGENADGFAAKLTIGHGNVFDGCIAYRNSDDGWDLYAKSDTGIIGCVFIYNCVAFENGYLEYTQAENHSRLNYNKAFDEPNIDSYETRDGDGNGFKLGGSVMNGDVFMYNCLAFQNKMHGVTDNSNPGYLKVENVTSYDNSAAIDNKKESSTFGQIISADNSDKHSNIDVARQTYSYNTLKNVVSVKSAIAKSLSADAYRGSVMNSLLLGSSKTNVVKGVIDADTKDSRISTATDHTSQVDMLNTSMFKQVPVKLDGETYNYAITGLKDSDNEVSKRIHDKYRNSDRSINMGDMLAIVDDFNFNSYLEEGQKAGSILNKPKWEDYKHFNDENLLDEINNEAFAKLLKTKEALVVDCEESAVYQNFRVFNSMGDCSITWTTSSSLLQVGKMDGDYLDIIVTRPADQDTPASLTATIRYGNYSISKDFTLVIKKDQPALGNIAVRVNETNAVYQDGGKIIFDAYSYYAEPTLEVQNAASYNGVLLSSKFYTVDTKYEFAVSAKAAFKEVYGFTVNHPGVYRITHNVTFANDPQIFKTMTYTIFVASPAAEVDFDGGANVSVFRDGYIISGNLTNVSGSIYSLTSETKLSDLTVANIKEYENVIKKDFKASSIQFTYDQDNSKDYFIYYALANGFGEITSNVYEVEIKVVKIQTQQEFIKVAGGETLSGEDVAKTIYVLTQDLDFKDTPYTVGSKAFKGLLNGQGHTISNITINEPKKDNIGIFSSIEGASIINIKFDKIFIEGAQRVGIAARVYGGYFHNIAITNINIRGTNQRTGGLIGQLFEGNTPTEITRVSLVNPIPTLTLTGQVDTSVEEERYYISGTGNRVAGLIGLIQTNNPIRSSLKVLIADCYVNSYIFGDGGYAVSSMIGQYDENGQLTNAQKNEFEFRVEIINCVSAGVLVSTAASSGRIGGMLGYHSGLGPLYVKGCLAVQEEYFKDELIVESQKYQSPIIGNYSTAAETLVEFCIANRQEANTEYDVSVYTERDLVYSFYFSSKDTWVDRAGFDISENGPWSLVKDEKDPQFLASPYIILNFQE